MAFRRSGTGPLRFALNLRARQAIRRKSFRGPIPRLHRAIRKLTSQRPCIEAAGHARGTVPIASSLSTVVDTLAILTRPGIPDIVRRLLVSQVIDRVGQPRCWTIHTVLRVPFVALEVDLDFIGTVRPTGSAAGVRMLRIRITIDFEMPTEARPTSTARCSLLQRKGVSARRIPIRHLTRIVIRRAEPLPLIRLKMAACAAARIVRLTFHITHRGIVCVRLVHGRVDIDEDIVGLPVLRRAGNPTEVWVGPVALLPMIGVRILTELREDRNIKLDGLNWRNLKESRYRENRDCSGRADSAGPSSPFHQSLPTEEDRRALIQILCRSWDRRDSTSTRR